LYKNIFMKEENKNKVMKIDAAGQTLGRLSSQIAAILLAKNSTSFAKNFAAKVKVEVSNASKIKVSGNKMKTRVHKRYTGYPSGLRLPTWSDVSAKKGYGQLIRHAVEGMLPKNSLQKERMKNLKVTE
jgi:large subunit ribosomal protein L13